MSAGPRPGSDSEGRWFSRSPAWPRRAPRTPAAQLSLGGVGPISEEQAAGLELGPGLEVEFVGSGSWGDAEGESSAEELLLRPWVGDGRCGTSNGLSASRGRRFETSPRSPSGGRASGSQPAHRSDPLGISEPLGPASPLDLQHTSSRSCRVLGYFATPVLPSLMSLSRILNVLPTFECRTSRGTGRVLPVELQSSSSSRVTHFLHPRVF